MAEPRPARLPQAAILSLEAFPNCEPETAFPAKSQEPNAWAAQRRPGAEHRLDLRPRNVPPLNAWPGRLASQLARVFGVPARRDADVGQAEQALDGGPL